MQISDHLKQALFYQKSLETDQFLESKSETLFQRPGKKSFIEVHYQQPEQQRLPSPAPVLDSKQDSQCSSMHPSLLDQSRCSSSDEDPPPTYDKSSRLLRQDILGLEDVKRIEMVSALVAALST